MHCYWDSRFIYFWLIREGKVKTDDRVAKILQFLNEAKIRATYGAVGEALGNLPGRSVGGMLGDRRPEASWVVNAETGDPTGYERNRCHPDLYRDPHIVKTGLELLRRMAGLYDETN